MKLSYTTISERMEDMNKEEISLVKTQIKPRAGGEFRHKSSYIMDDNWPLALP